MDQLLNGREHPYKSAALLNIIVTPFKMYTMLPALEATISLLLTCPTTRAMTYLTVVEAGKQVTNSDIYA